MLFIWLYFGVWCWGSFSHFGCSFIFLGLGDFVVVLGFVFGERTWGRENMIKIYLNFKNVLNN